MEINKPVTIVIILIIDLVLTFLFVVPKYKDIADAKVNLNQKQSEYDNLTDHYLKLLNAVKSIDARKSDFEKIDTALPNHFSFSPLIYFLQEKAGENGLTIKSITSTQFFQDQGQQASSQDSQEQVKNIDFTINLSGSYQGLKKFVMSLERSARLFEVKSISFSSSDQNFSQNQPNNYDFKLELGTHAY